MKKQIKIILMVMMIFVLSCQGGADDPKFWVQRRFQGKSDKKIVLKMVTIGHAGESDP